MSKLSDFSEHSSLHQYFLDKRHLYPPCTYRLARIALHERHISEINGIVQSTLVEHGASPLEDLVRAMVEAIVEAHTTDAELYELSLTEVPH